MPGKIKEEEDMSGSLLYIEALTKFLRIIFNICGSFLCILKLLPIIITETLAISFSKILCLPSTTR